MGGMLPEQIWDYKDIPSKGMYLGRPAGSAQPLVWAHAEYLKLLRSAADGRVFDRISVVEERYAVAAGKRTFTNHIEIFEVTRPVVDDLLRTIRCGSSIANISVLSTRLTTGRRRFRRRRIRLGIRDRSWIFRPLPDQTGELIFTLAWPGQARRNVGWAEISLCPLFLRRHPNKR